MLGPAKVVQKPICTMPCFSKKPSVLLMNRSCSAGSLPGKEWEIRISTIMLMSWVEGYGMRMFVLRSVNHILFITRPLVLCHGSDVVGCAQPSERSARRIGQPIQSAFVSD